MSNAVVPLSIAPIEDGDVDAVVGLWERCGLTRPWNEPAADIALAERYIRLTSDIRDVA